MDDMGVGTRFMMFRPYIAEIESFSIHLFFDPSLILDPPFWFVHFFSLGFFRDKPKLPSVSSVLVSTVLIFPSGTVPLPF